MAFHLLHLFLILFAFNAVHPSHATMDDASLFIQTSSGSVQGRLVHVVDDKSVRQFLGIPFAEPPVRELRFSRPKPAKAWTGVRQAIEYGYACLQVDIATMMSAMYDMNTSIPKVPEGEDCLTINVFTPANTKPDAKLAVMVWIYGGGFTVGTARYYDPSVIVALHDIIVVTFNYRLGVFGFLNIPGTDIKGNYGMFDQVLALQWVQDNINYFGGDRNTVTIFGESAGGMSVSSHILSPLSKGLFHRAIPQSGSSVSAFCCHKVETRDTVEKVAKMLGCSLGDELIGCLRSTSARELLEASLNYTFPTNMRENDISTIVIDGEFLPDAPKTLLKEGKINHVDVMMGFTREEGGWGPLAAPNKSRDGTPQWFLETIVRHGSKMTHNQNKLVEDAVLFEYTDHADPDNNITIRRNVIDVGGEGILQAPTIFEADALVEAGVPVYLYLFRHHPTFSAIPEWTGAYHFSDVYFVFGAPIKRMSRDMLSDLISGYTDLEKGLSLYVMKLWTNFAKHGDPNKGGHMPVTWPRYTNPEHAHLNIELQPSVGTKYRAHKMAFWNDFIPHLTKIKTDNSGKKKNAKDEL